MYSSIYFHLSDEQCLYTCWLVHIISFFSHQSPIHTSRSMSDVIEKNKQASNKLVGMFEDPSFLFFFEPIICSLLLPFQTAVPHSLSPAISSVWWGYNGKTSPHHMTCAFHLSFLAFAATREKPQEERVYLVSGDLPTDLESRLISSKSTINWKTISTFRLQN